MATATTNKLPEFATDPQDNTFDEEIIDKSSELEDTGFVPNTTIRSSQMNTYMKMMIESLRGIVDGLYRQAAAQGEIKANSTAQEWQDYIQKGLNDLITKTKVNNAGTADTTTGNSATATKLQNARTFNISGDATGTAQSFDGTANVTIPIDVKKSAALDSTNVGDSTHPVYFDANGKPVEVNQKIANDTSGKADTAGTADEAIKLQTPRNIALAGDATGSASFDGSANATITVDVKTAAALDSKNIGNSANPVYFDANGKPQATTSPLFKSITGNAATATKLATARIIQLIGDVIGQVSFDGTQNVQIDTTSVITNAKQVVDNLGNPLTVGSTNVPVYFNNGVPEELTKTVFDKEWITINPDASGNFQMPGLSTVKNGSIEVLFGESELSSYPQSFGVVSYHDFGTITEVCSLSVDNNGSLFMLRYNGNSMSIYKDSGSGFVKLKSGIMYVKKLQGY